MTPADHYASLFLRAIRDRRASLQDDLAKGGATDFPAYRYKVGELHGLTAAIDMAVASLELVMKSDDDDE